MGKKCALLYKKFRVYPIMESTGRILSRDVRYLSYVARLMARRPGVGEPFGVTGLGKIM